jgi:hypothetical protein
MNTSPSPTPFLNYFWPKLVLILAALGVPVAVVTFFRQFITEYPWLALIIGLLYEVVVFILGFIGKVWKNLEEPWAKKVADWFNHRVQEAISRYRKQYYQYLRYQHRDFDVKGLTTLGTYALELDQIFVELGIDPTRLKQVSPNPILLPQTLSEGNHSLWDYLASKPLKNQHFVIIGPPGSGKTTLLKHIALTLADYKNQRHDRERIPHTFPILLFLRDHIQSIEDQHDFSLAHALRDHLKKWKQSDPPANWIERQLASKRCLVMLDGLDDVADPQARQKVVGWVETQMIAFKESRFVVTSRPFGYHSNPLRRATVLKVRPLSHEQIERFIHRWYLANEIMDKQENDPKVHKRASAEAENLLLRLRNVPALFALTVNPLLLTMIATVHCYSDRDGLPGDRMALYAGICKVFLDKCQQARGQVLELTSAQIQLVLESLAYYMMLNGKPDITVADARDAIKKPLEHMKLQIPPDDFLRLVENGSGLLLQQKKGVYNFAHLTFQEYLTAVHIHEMQLGDILIAHLEENWWQETIRLYCAMSDATPIIATCLRDDPPSVYALTLALAYIEEARDVQPEINERLETILNQGIEDSDEERRRIVAEALLARRQRQMVCVKEGVYRDTSLVTCAEYQVFLDEQRRQGRFYQPYHWNSISFPSGFGRAPILGVHRSDALAFCNWLTARNREGWHYRLPRLEEWSLEERQKELHAETGYWVEDEPYFVWLQGKPSSVLNKQLFDCVACHLDLPRDRALDNVIARDLADDLASALSRDRDLARARDLVLDLALGLARDLADDLVLSLALDLARARPLALDLALDFTRDLIHAFAYTFALDRALDLARDLTSVLDRAIARASDLSRDPNLARALDLYITLSLLQERIAGNLPVYEGILLVKDREQVKRNK